MNITIHRNGENYGPYTLDQIKEYLGNGTLIETDLAWYEGCRDWLPIKDVVNSDSTVSPLSAHEEYLGHPQEASVAPVRLLIKPYLIGGLTGLFIVTLIGVGCLWILKMEHHESKIVGAAANISSSANMPSDLNPSNNTPEKTDQELFTGKWHYKHIEGGTITLAINFTSDGGNIIMEAWLPKKTPYKSEGTLSFSHGVTFNDGRRSRDNVRVASFLNNNENDKRPTLLMTAGDGKYLFCFQSDEHNMLPLETGLMQFPGSDNSHIQLADMVGDYSGRTDSYNPKGKDGNEVVYNGRTLTIPAVSVDITVSNNSLKLKQVADGSDEVLEESNSGDLQVMDADKNSITVEGEFHQGGDAGSDIRYKFALNKDGTAKMLPEAGSDEPITNLTKEAQQTMETNSSSTVEATANGNSSAGRSSRPDSFNESKTDDSTVHADLVENGKGFILVSLGRVSDHVKQISLRGEQPNDGQFTYDVKFDDNADLYVTIARSRDEWKMVSAKDDKNP